MKLLASLLPVLFFACSHPENKGSEAKAVDYGDSFIFWQGVVDPAVIRIETSDIILETKQIVPGDIPELKNAQISEMASQVAANYFPLTLLDQVKGISPAPTSAEYFISINDLRIVRYTEPLAAAVNATDPEAQPLFKCGIGVSILVTDTDHAVRSYTNHWAESADAACLTDPAYFANTLSSTITAALEKIPVIH